MQTLGCFCPCQLLLQAVREQKEPPSLYCFQAIKYDKEWVPRTCFHQRMRQYETALSDTNNESHKTIPDPSTLLHAAPSCIYIYIQEFATFTDVSWNDAWDDGAMLIYSILGDLHFSSKPYVYSSREILMASKQAGTTNTNKEPSHASKHVRPFSSSFFPSSSSSPPPNSFDICCVYCRRKEEKAPH